jgi:hypothetical protein
MRLAFVYNKFTPENTVYDSTHPDYNLLYIINNGILERAATMAGDVDNYSNSQGFI